MLRTCSIVLAIAAAVSCGDTRDRPPAEPAADHIDLERVAKPLEDGARARGAVLAIDLDEGVRRIAALPVTSPELTRDATMRFLSRMGRLSAELMRGAPR
jgi:hypothetical protein